ncbi:tetratricopeptide repeat protein [Ferrimonas aestuarii]|uniref:Tetratricopeptide repeat protein n=1 Tax=Ferrimonas aestuarii TaxID=2569539 RepID=A0A4U1BS59_9GAMM|nr:tetratricopeptide repeat protein [Ferrimonas aestuarii]TKB58473.1 tetratricopeptide repeat protein [Ferrimonas aestuarii]
MIAKYALIPALILPLLLTGCASTQAPKSSEVTRLIKAQNHQGLADYYQQQLQQHPDDPQILLALAQSFYDAGDLESSEFYLNHLHRIDAEPTAQSLLLLGKLLNRKQDYAAGIDALQRALALGQNSGDLWLQLGMAYTQTAQFEPAVEAFNQARLLGSDPLMVKNNLAMVEMAQGHYQQAAKLLEPLYEQHPDNPQVQANLALAWAKSGELSRAHRLLRQLYPDTELSGVLTQLQQL